MPSLSLRSDGAIAKYLGFCTAQPYMYPKSFCTLFWWILLGPLAIIPCWIFRGIQELEIKWHEQKQKQHEREVNALIALYKAEPYEAFIDFVEHFDCHLKPEDCKRSKWRIVEEAFRQLRSKYDISICYEERILCHLGLVPWSDDSNEYINWDIYDDMKHKYLLGRPQKSNHKKKLPSSVIFWFTKTPFTALWIVPCFAAEVIYDGAFAAFYPIAVAFVLFGFLFIRMELDTVVYQCYRAIKDRTCPIIEWEGSVVN